MGNGMRGQFPGGLACPHDMAFLGPCAPTASGWQRGVRMSLKEQSTLHWVETVLTSPCPVLGLQTPDLSVFPEGSSNGD